MTIAQGILVVVLVVAAVVLTPVMAVVAVVAVAGVVVVAAKYNKRKHNRTANASRLLHGFAILMQKPQTILSPCCGR
jgi:Flp pilus assembly protein TadB